MGIPQASRRRAKLSITVSRETLEFLRSRVASGQPASIGDAIDAVIERLRQLENRHRLASATERYFDQLEPDASMLKCFFCGKPTGEPAPKCWSLAISGG